MSKYSEIEYPRDESGLDDYPQRLVDYLIKRFKLRSFILDIGCGKGDYVKAFRRRGLNAEGVDRDTPLCELNLDTEALPYLTNSCDFIFSKSTLEHLWNWEHVLEEGRRVLRANGLAIFIVPDWNSQKWKFYDDPTHVKPYTKKSLKMAMELIGFRDVHCEYINLNRFKRWNRLPAWLLYFRDRNLLCYARK